MHGASWKLQFNWRGGGREAPVGSGTLDARYSEEPVLTFSSPSCRSVFRLMLVPKPSITGAGCRAEIPKQEILTRPCRRKLPAKSVGSVAYNAAIGACGYAHSAERARVLRSGAVVHVEILLSAKRSPTSWLSAVPYLTLSQSAE